MIPTIPHYSLLFHVGELSAPTPSNVHIIKRSLSPKESVNTRICDLLDSVGVDYVFAAKEGFVNKVFARLRFIPSVGIVFQSSTDERIRTVFEKNINNHRIAVPKNQLPDLHLAKHAVLTQDQVEESLREEAEKIFDEQEVLHVSLHDWLVASRYISEDMTIDLELDVFQPFSCEEKFSTGHLRFPHLLRHLFIKYPTAPKNMQICILGPGISKTGAEPPLCPQLFELFALFPSAHFTLLDKEPEVLEAINKYRALKSLFYDPSTLKALSLPVSLNVYYAPHSYQDFFKILKKNIVNISFNKLYTLKAFDLKESSKPVVCNCEQGQLHPIEFNILESNFTADAQKKFQVVVATMSLSFALKESVEKYPWKNPFTILGKFLGTLQENGVLYVDCYLYELLKQTYGEEGTHLGLMYLEHQLENKLSVEKILLADFQPDILGDVGVTLDLTIESLYKNDMPIVTTTSVLAFTRLEEKVDNWEAKKAIGLQLIKLLNSLKP